MVSNRLLIIVLSLIILSWGIISVLNCIVIMSENSITRILSYDVYRIEGSGDYIIYYPLPNGSIKVLKKGKANSFFPVFVKVPREEWTRIPGKALYAPPTPLILYVTRDGKLGVKSITSSRIKFDDGLDLKGNQIQIKSACPKGWIDFGGRYCLSPKWSLQFNAEAKVLDEWVSIMGMKIENKTIERMDFDWDLVLSRSAYSYWMIGIDVGPFTIPFVSRKHLEGWVLSISYEPIGPLSINNTWERYLSVRVEYLVIHSRVPAYDKLVGKRIWIEITQTYPIKIHSTGDYTIWESPARGIYFTESKGDNPPRITTTPNIWSISKEVKWKRKLINSTGHWVGAILVKKHPANSFSLGSSLSIPIDYGGFPSSLSLTAEFRKYMNAVSIILYSVDVKPRKSCYAMYSVLDVKVGESEPRVAVPLVFSVITDDETLTPPCNSKTGLCITTTNPEQS
nr:TPA: hypothetical protein PAB0875 [Pyrococcus abyssi GE5]